jgi:hypothetical protein
VRVRASLELEDGDDPDRRAPPVSERERGEERGARVGPRAGEGKKGAGWVGPCGRKGRKGERPAGLGRVEEKEKMRKKMGRAKRRKRERERKKCIEMHLNLNLKFKFK